MHVHNDYIHTYRPRSRALFPAFSMFHVDKAGNRTRERGYVHIRFVTALMVCYSVLSGRKKLPITVLITTTLITILLIITVLAVIITFAIRQHNKKSKTYNLY